MQPGSVVRIVKSVWRCCRFDSWFYTFFIGLVSRGRGGVRG